MLVREQRGDELVNTTLLRCIATLLITNSHLDVLYPDARLGTGGALGNTLFFLLSGYGLALSLTGGRGASENFPAYFFRRLLRLYPGLILVSGVVILLDGRWRELNLMGWGAMFLWPTWYWFLSAIVIFYIPFYWVGKWVESHLILAIGILTAPYFYSYFSFVDLSRFSIEDGYFKWIVYFQLMLFGAWLAKRKGRGFHIIRDALGLVSSALIFYLLKVLLFRIGLGSLQFLAHAMLFPFAFFAFRFLTDSRVFAVIERWGLGWAVSFFGGLTLEAYLVQVPLIPAVAKLGLPFPFGWVIALVLIAVLAAMVSKFSKGFLRLVSSTQVKNI